MAKSNWLTGFLYACRDRMRRVFRALKCKRLKRSRKRRHIRSVPTYTHCKNCQTELSGMYCHHCGQYALDVNQTFVQYIKQFAENSYLYDGRMVATFRSLFTAPGRLTNEFMAGKVNRYVHPLKLYMFLSIIFFTFVLMTVGATGKTNLSIESNIARSSVGVDSISALLKDTTIIDWSKSRVATNGDLFSGEAATSKKINESKQVKDSIDKALTEQREEMFKERIMSDLQSNFPIVLMLLIPLYALIVRLLYRRSRKKYLQCFVFALHNSTMLLVFMSVSVLIDTVDMINSWSAIFLYLLLLVYMAVSARNVFGTGWVRSSVMTFLGFNLYVLICVLLLGAYLTFRVVSIYSAVGLGNILTS